MRLLIFLPLAMVCLGQPVEAQKRSIAAMRISIARQQAAVAAMRASAGKQFRSGFTLGQACEALSRSEIAALAGAAAAREGLPAEVVTAVIERESAGRPCAVSRRGALGLMQLMPETARALEVSDPFNTRQNVLAGTRYLRWMLERFGGDLALAAYNAGPARVEAAGGLPPLAETFDYVSSILARLGLGGQDSPGGYFLDAGAAGSGPTR